MKSFLYNTCVDVHWLHETTVSSSLALGLGLGLGLASLPPSLPPSLPHNSKNCNQYLIVREREGGREGGVNQSERGGERERGIGREGRVNEGKRGGERGGGREGGSVRE